MPDTHQLDADYRRVLYDRYVSAFKSHATRRINYTFSNSKLLPLITPWIRGLDRSVSCIDLGCGNGNILHALKTLGFSKLNGVDLSQEQVDMARLISDNVEQGELLESLQRFPNSYFGIITLFDVVEHLKKGELLDLLSVIREKLIPGGMVIIHCPNGDSPFGGQVMASDYTHETLLNAGSARNLCELFQFTNFEASEHLGASRTFSGAIRGAAWRVLRQCVKFWNWIETGSAGSGILTRSFAFKMVRPKS